MPSWSTGTTPPPALSMLTSAGGPPATTTTATNDWFSCRPVDPNGTSFTGVETVVYDIDPPSPTVMSVSSTAAAGTYGTSARRPHHGRRSTSRSPSTCGMARHNWPEQRQRGPYAAGSGGTTLTFNYTVANRQNTPDLDYASPAAPPLDGGGIANIAGTAAPLTLPAPGSDGLAEADVAIDTTHTGPVFKLLEQPHDRLPHRDHDPRGRHLPGPQRRDGVDYARQRHPDGDG